ncbi:MAG TPA: Ig-like domain-containing protein [Thermoanaerobaculia bacterium]
MLLLLLAALPALAGPQATIVSPPAGAAAIGEVVIEVATSIERVDRVEIRVDGRLVGVLRTPPYRLPFDFGSAPAAHRIEAEVFGDGYAQRARAESVTAVLQETVTVDWVEVPLAIRFRGARAPRLEDFRVLENGVEQTVRELKPTRGPARFVFVLDRSLSMKGERLDAAIAAIRAAQARLRPGDTSEVLLFNHRVAEPLPLARVTADASGGTALRDALASIRPAARTVAIVISDGADRNSFLSTREGLEAVAVSNLTVHALALGGGAGTSFLRDVAARTGGSFRRSSAATLARDMNAAFDDLDGRWVLAYQSASGRPGWRAIEVRPRTADVRIASARKGYFAE